MIQSADNYPISQLLDIYSPVEYYIPRYQREYTWGRGEWEKFFDDILENDYGYFLGSIICINQSKDTLKTQQLEIVDGQQRMTTLSLLYAAIYSYLKEFNGLEYTDLIVESTNLKHHLVHKRNTNKPRLILQIQNYNNEDYCAVLGEAGIIESYKTPPNAGNRRIFRAYRYFKKRIVSLSEGLENGHEEIKSFLEKLNQTTIVKIEVGSHSDAYILFESLNNRGVPLSSIDLIKTKLLAQLEVDDPGSINFHFEKWNYFLKFLGDEYTIQERFFRQYFNAFRQDFIKICSYPVATRSNIIDISEKLIKDDAKEFLDKNLEIAKIYSFILGIEDNEYFHPLAKSLKDLDHIQGTPSYLLLMFLLKEKDTLKLDNTQLKAIIEKLVCFFVRRNLTDVPPTRDLTRMFMKIIDKVNGLSGDEIIDTIVTTLSDVSSEDARFQELLEGPIYKDNAWVTRFLLCYLEESAMTREKEVDLWAKYGNNYVWTIEHIFPQGDNIPQSWVDMIAEGDHEKARALQEEHVHKIGNLTISGFNSNLGNKGFEYKRDRKDDNGNYIGYKNKLKLNRDLENINEWTVENIEKRTEKLVKEIMDMFSLK